MTVLLYSGSGKDAPEEYLFLRDDTELTGNVKVIGIKDLAFPTVSRNRKEICGVDIQKKASRIIRAPLGNKQAEPEVVFVVGENAVYYPSISPSGNRIAYIETEGRFYPPMRDDVGLLKIIEKQGTQWKKIDFSYETYLEPIEWSRTDDALFLPAETGELKKVSISGEEETITNNAFYPCLSISERMFAYFNGKCIVVEKEGGLRAEYADGEDVQLLAWGKDDNTLYFACNAGFWKMDAKRINLETEEIDTVFTTSEITFLTELLSNPAD